MADQLFEQTDINKDQRIDINEFRTLIEQNLGPGAAIYTGDLTTEARSSYETSLSPSYIDTNLSQDAYSGTASFLGPDQLINNIQNNYSLYEQTNYAPSPGLPVNAFDNNIINNNADISQTNITTTTTSPSPLLYEAHRVQTQMPQYPTTPQGLYQDPNPQIIRRPAPEGQVTYTQNIKIRFLQPPAVPPPGPLIIKEVRPPQPPPPPPLVVRQRAPQPEQLPPLVLRERPPPMPVSVGPETVIRKLAPLPNPPRSVIIERLPALPPKPRDIIIERWLPYSFTTKRKTIVQRAETPKDYPKPRNVIIQYDPPQVRIVRQFQRLGVTQENPQEYAQRFGPSLYDTQALIERARAAGVVEDISTPDIGNRVQTNEASFSSASPINPSPYDGAVDSNFSSFYRSNSFSSQIADHEIAGSGYENYSTTVSGNNLGFGSETFNTADLNHDGSIDQDEFRQFLNTQLQ